MMAILAAGLTFAAVFVAVATLLAPSRQRDLSRRLWLPDGGAATGREGKLSTPFLQRVGLPLIGRLVEMMSRPLPSRLVASMEDRLAQAGDPIKLSSMLIWQGAMLLMGVALLLLALGSASSGATVLVMLTMGLLLAVIPTVWLRSKIQTRQKAVLRELPDALDLIVTVVEAGMSIDAAMGEVAEEAEGPLGEELLVVMREMALGRSRRDALLALLERLPVADLKSFIHALLHAQATGIPLGQVLRAQADEMRVRRRQRAEETAGRAPVKMVLVLIFFVMPSMLMFMMGPAAIRFMAAGP